MEARSYWRKENLSILDHFACNNSQPGLQASFPSSLMIFKNIIGKDLILYDSLAGSEISFWHYLPVILLSCKIKVVYIVGRQLAPKVEEKQAI